MISWLDDFKMSFDLPVDIALMPADVVGGGLDKIVSIPCGLAAPCGPNWVCVGFWSWNVTPLPRLLVAFISAIECNAASGGPKKLNCKLCGSNITQLNLTNHFFINLPENVITNFLFGFNTIQITFWYFSYGFHTTIGGWTTDWATRQTMISRSQLIVERRKSYRNRVDCTIEVLKWEECRKRVNWC